MPDCRCFRPPFDYRHYTTTVIGEDPTNGRYGTVTVQTCTRCGARWLHYLVEYEFFSGSGRWFRGLIPDMDPGPFFPRDAVPYLEKLPWYFGGGSYFGGRIRKMSGAVPADL